MCESPLGDAEGQRTRFVSTTLTTLMAKGQALEQQVSTRRQGERIAATVRLASRIARTMASYRASVK
jgi:hypothetical protein